MYFNKKRAAIINKNFMVLKGIIYTWQGNQQLKFYEFWDKMPKTYIFYVPPSNCMIFMPTVSPANL